MSGRNDKEKLSGNMEEQIQSSAKISLRGLTPCLMFAMTGTIGYGLNNVLPELVQQTNAMVLYSVLTILIQLVSTLASPLAGCFGDVWGRRKVVITCLLFFCISEIRVGFVTNPYELILVISVMMLTFSICQTSTTAMVCDVSSGEVRSSLMGIRHSSGQLAMLLGPVITGTLNTWFGIRTTYLLLAPLGVVSMILVAMNTPNIVYEHKSKKIDWPGILFLLLAMTGISILMSAGGTIFPWVSWCGISIMVLSAISTVAFGLIEWKEDNPLINFNIFSYTGMKPVMMYKLLMQISNGLFGGFLILYCQQIIGMNTMQTGFFGLARIAAILGSSVVGVWIGKKGRLTASAMTASLLTLTAEFMLVFIHKNTSFLWIFLAQILLSLSTSFGTIPLSLAMSEILPVELQGNGFGTFFFCENLGSLLGTALVALVINVFGGGKLTHSFNTAAAVCMAVVVLQVGMTHTHLKRLEKRCYGHLI